MTSNERRDKGQYSIDTDSIGMADSRPLNKGFLISAGVIMGAASLRQESLLSMVDLRGAFPEPLDVANHAANTMWTFGLSSMALMGLKKGIRNPENTFSYGLTQSNNIELTTESEFKRKRNILLGATATLSVGLNLYSEAVASAQFDGLDFAYGMIGGAIAYATQRLTYTNHEETADVMHDLPRDNAIKKRYQKLTKERGARRGGSRK